MKGLTGSAGWMVAVAVLSAVVLPRLVVLPVSVIDWDESSYALVAQQMLQGRMPYDAVFDHKPIGLYLVFAAFIALIGDSVVAIRVIPIVFAGATAVLLAWLARKQFLLGPYSSAAIAALYGLLTLINGGLATNTEILINLFLVASVALIVRGELARRISLPYALSAGAMLGAAFQVNYLGGILVAGTAAFYLAWISGSDRPATVTRLYLTNGIFMFAGFLLANIALILPLVFAGDIAAYLGLQIAYLADYSSKVDGGFRLGRLYEAVLPILPFVALGAVFVGKTLHGMLFRRDRPPSAAEERSLRAWVVLWIFATVTAFASGRLYSHFFLFILPASLMLTAGVLWACRSQPALRRGLAVWMLLMAAFVTVQSDGIFKDGLRGYRNVFLRGQAPDAVAQVSKSMSAQLGVDDTIYVYDAEIVHYFQTRTLPPTRFAFPNSHLRESESARFGFDRGDHMRDILATDPKFIVVGGNPSDLLYGEASAVLAEALAQRYSLIEGGYRSRARDVVVYRRNGASD
jgi:4-amino-4-deoxy-L-arabinose transferase-like glycosyltransferase